LSPGLIYLLEKNLVTCIFMFDIGRMPIHAEQKDKEQRHFSFFNKSALPFEPGLAVNQLVNQSMSQN